MRLIDADALDNELGISDEDINFHFLLQEAPTIDPVRHGRWIPLNDQIAKCSVCGAMESTYGKDKTGQALIHKAIKHYCPNCGAKMDEEVSHEDR